MFRDKICVNGTLSEDCLHLNKEAKDKTRLDASQNDDFFVMNLQLPETSSITPKLSQDIDGCWVGDEKTVTLTNTSLNVENSTVHIGNVIHHHLHIPEDSSVPNDHAYYPEKPDQSKEVTAIKFDFFFSKRRNCVAVILVILATVVGILALVYLAQTSKETNSEEDENSDGIPSPKPSHSFGNLSEIANCKIFEEEDWGLKRNLGDIELKHPVPLVIISHSVTPFCNTTKACRGKVEGMQQYHINNGSPDIGYNFIVGGDGNIYVGRGWNARNFHLGNHSIGINFVGNFFRDELTPQMIRCAKAVIDYGVKSKILEDDYKVVGHNQTNSKVLSPGPNVYAEVKKWPHFMEGEVSRSYLYGV